MILLGMDVYHAGASAAVVRDGQLVAITEDEALDGFQVSGTDGVVLGPWVVLSERAARTLDRYPEAVATSNVA